MSDPIGTKYYVLVISYGDSSYEGPWCTPDIRDDEALAIYKELDIDNGDNLFRLDVYPDGSISTRGYTNVEMEGDDEEDEEDVCDVELLDEEE